MLVMWIHKGHSNTCLYTRPKSTLFGHVKTSIHNQRCWSVVQPRCGPISASPYETGCWYYRKNTAIFLYAPVTDYQKAYVVTWSYVWSNHVNLGPSVCLQSDKQWYLDQGNLSTIRCVNTLHGGGHLFVLQTDHPVGQEIHHKDKHLQPLKNPEYTINRRKKNTYGPDR